MDDCIPMDPIRKKNFATGGKMYLARVLNMQGKDIRRETILAHKPFATATEAFVYSKKFAMRLHRGRTFQMQAVFMSPKNVIELQEA